MNDWESNGQGDHRERDLYLDWVRVSCSGDRYGAWETVDRDTPRTPLADHPAVMSYRIGIGTDDLTSFVEAFASLRASRIKGVGAEQYARPGEGQKFEKFSMDDTVRELVDELADASNYLDFLAIKVLSLLRDAKDTGIDCD